ncbi:MAG: hypothetical protein HOD85_04860 [Deltaproteobacteria bacterium]|nr:hypothetical protein [Deltaproteobacteria bacterium]MBT4642385.1 hypothetical protein [Deltaproteobacteria bacterium]
MAHLKRKKRPVTIKPINRQEPAEFIDLNRQRKILHPTPWIHYITASEPSDY